jgi:uncharacterized SAM-binding protein YcdF (DUF218 family)
LSKNGLEQYNYGMSSSEAFVFSKVLGPISSPDNAIVLLLLLGVAAAMGRRWRAAGLRLCLVITLSLLAVAILPVGEWLLVPLENRFPPAHLIHVGGILLLAEDEQPQATEMRGQPVTYMSASNYFVFANLVRAWPEAKLAFSGGSGSLLFKSRVTRTNSDVARQLLNTLGIPSGHVVFENSSRTTHENAVMSAALIRPGKEAWLLVASASHMPRSIACFREAGWNIYPAPADYLTDGRFSSGLGFDLAGHLMQISIAAHEYFGLVAYWVMGYISSPWPR